MNLANSLVYLEISDVPCFLIQHREFAKRKKRVASELCDKEKLSDSFLAIGESYQKLRNFGKARKWYMKSWNGYKLIGNLEVKYIWFLLGIKNIILFDIMLH